MMAAIFILPTTVYAAKNYERELTAAQKRLVNLKAEMNDVKADIVKVKETHIKKEKALQKDIAEKKQDAKGTPKSKKIVADAKVRQQELRQDYKNKKKPLSKKLNDLALEYRQCKHEIKKIEKKIKRAAEGYFEDDKYLKAVKKLKGQLRDLKVEFKESLVKLQKESDEKIAAITDLENKAKQQKEIRIKAKKKEKAIRQKYAEEKQALVNKLDKAKAAHRQRVKENRESKRSQERAKPKKSKAKKAVSDKAPTCAPTQNFGVK